MRKFSLLISGLLLSFLVSAQQKPVLTVEKIMRDPKWIGSSPSNPQWDLFSVYLYFNWNPDNAPADSMFYVTMPTSIVNKIRPDQLKDLNINAAVYSRDRKQLIYELNGDIWYQYLDNKKGKKIRITQTTETESNPQFSFQESRVVYTRNMNLYSWNISTGETEQLTNFKTGDLSNSISGTPKGNAQENWLRNDQLKNFDVLRDRKKNRDAADAYNKTIPKPKELRAISVDDRGPQGTSISPDGRFVTWRIFKNSGVAKSTIVANYVTETGFTTDINGRSKVGAPQGSSDMYVFDRVKDTIVQIQLDSINGIRDIPEYLKDYPKLFEERSKKPATRAVSFSNASWAPNSKTAVFDVRAQDNKDRWLLLLDTTTLHVSLLDRQHDSAWIAGPGIGFGRNTGWTDDDHFWYQSEVSGYSHIYLADTRTGEKRAITSGRYEVQQAQLSLDKKYFYIHTNEVHPGEQQFYRLTIADGKRERITLMPGSNQVTVSPDEQWLAILHSYSNQPWELFIQRNPFASSPYKTAATPPVQLANKAMSPEFAAYPWRDPELISFKARDGADVYARVYKPEKPNESHAAVLFVHGAGYLQNAHKWWSSYFREYMFNNLLADKGYYVMDIDYRGSAGYGRDCRTGIYRFMGGKDLTDNIDGVKYLEENYGVDPKHVGLYGGSYGGFITLMGMFTAPDVFAAGAALRPVTDWANYNHGYTANILNEPYNDSLAYYRSSPYYHAAGLKGSLLICHGMVDVNVHFQDAVKLAQRLIELGKDNWTIAPYPMEDHGFVEPSSWTDEYKRILKLFETNLR